ncbi:actin cross-linking protein (DUF569) [Rhynchospora pubera]|uniref:Actin cross-linking protein (DUF569) n=1 Tax=Rhynchospora pubera TaxID=906938 RepID=A0AAV8D2M3_9POAL|nr:actin cross-linking protein (DUF569) [Rhynchospora pubera]
MELFQRAKAVRLKSRHDKYLFADEDETHVIQDRNGASPNARWHVEAVYHGGAEPHGLRFKSRYGRYLTASNEPFLMGVTGRKVLQTTVSGKADSSVEWEPVRDGFQVRLKTRYGNFLRANGGLPPWRNSVTHDVPHRSSTQDWVLWDVEIVEIATPKPTGSVEKPVPMAEDQRRQNGSLHRHDPPTDHRRTGSMPVNHGANGAEGNAKFSKLESLDSISMPVHKVEGRQIYYRIADDNGNFDEAFEAQHFIFNGTSLDELTEKLREEVGRDDIIICTMNSITNKLMPLRLQLPPNNAAMNIVIVEESSKVAKTFPSPFGS